MSETFAPGWYPDPVEPEVQRYWDGEQWLGSPIPVAATPPATPPTAPRAAPAQPALRGMPLAVQTPPVGTDTAQPVPLTRVGGRVLVHGRELAPLSARFMARLVDILVITGLNLAVNGWFLYQWFREMLPVYVETQRWVAGQIPEQPMPTERATNLLYAIVLIATALWFAYEVPATAWRGQTLGKRLFEIRVVRYDGNPLGFGLSFARWFIMALPNVALGWLAPFQVADVLWCTWDRPLRQCLHDKRARGVVVQLGAQDRQNDRTPA
jgi:uncharacterized RDD family membrane protein YckC